MIDALLNDLVVLVELTRNAAGDADVDNVVGTFRAYVEPLQVRDAGQFEEQAPAKVSIWLGPEAPVDPRVTYRVRRGDMEYDVIEVREHNDAMVPGSPVHHWQLLAR